MNDENLHITPDPHKGIPEPEIPADEAWNNMAAMLDAAMPVSPPDSSPSQKPPSTGGGGILGGISQFWSIGLIVLGVAGVVTWGVLRHTNKPETYIIKKDTINVIRPTPVTDSLTTTNQNKPTITGSIKTPAAIGDLDSKMNLPQNPAELDITVHPKVIPQSASIAKNEQHPALSFSSGSKQSEPKTKDIIPSQTGTDNTTTAVSNNSNQQPVIKEKSKDTVKLSEVQPSPPSPDAESVNLSDNSVPARNSDVNPPTDKKADNKQKNAVPEKSKNPIRMSENLSWQSGVSGNTGEVIQKGRYPNLFYGAMVTGGLWHKKLKAGLETGIIYAAYNDYGSVSNNVRITDSVPGDSVHPVTQIDTTRIVGYKYRYQYLLIPLFISKQVMSKGKFALDIKTGPVFGFLISQRQIPDYNSGPENGEILSTVNV